MQGFRETELSSSLHHLLSEGPFSFLVLTAREKAGQDGGSVTLRFWKSVSMSPLPGGEDTLGCPEAGLVLCVLRQGLLLELNYYKHKQAACLSPARLLDFP